MEILSHLSLLLMLSLQFLQMQPVLLVSRYNNNNNNKIMISKYICIMQGMPRSLITNKPLETTSKYGKGSTNEDTSSLDVVSPGSRNDTGSTTITEEDTSSHNTVSTERKEVSWKAHTKI